MTETRIITNNHKRPLLSWYELTEAEKLEFDWIENPEDCASDFFRYRGEIYTLLDMDRLGSSGYTGNINPFPGWAGYRSDSFFSGIVVKFPVESWGDVDTENIIVGLYLS